MCSRAYIRVLCSVLLMQVPVWCAAQKGRTELHISPFHFERLFVNDGFAPAAFRLSFEREHGDRMMFGIDVHMLWRGLLRQSMQDRSHARLVYDGYEADYVTNKREWGIAYRAGFFFEGDADAGVYLGSMIGLRYVTREIQVTDKHYYTAWWVKDPFKEGYTASKVLIPIGLRLGFRGAYLYGGESDIYFGLAYQLGGGTNMFSEPELQDADAVPARLTYTMGFAWIVDLK